MKHIATQIFVTLGVIFLILILIGVYFFVTDPYGLKPLIFGGSVPTQSTSVSAQSESENTSENSDGSASDEEEASAGGFELSDAQVEALISLGIDPASVPSSISAEQEACFVSALGEERVAEIRVGAVPSALELLKAESCI